MATVRLDQFGDQLPEGALVRLGTLRLRHAQVGSNAMLFSRDGKTLITGGVGKVVLWDVATGRETRRLATSESLTHALALSPDGKVLASAGPATVYLWQLDSGRQLRALPGVPGRRGQANLSLAFSPDGQTLVSGGNVAASAARFWDVATGQERPQIKVAARGINLVGYTPDNRYLILASAMTHSIVLVDVAAHREIRSYQPPAWDYEAAALAPDGQTLAFASRLPGAGAGLVSAPRLLDLATGRVLRKFPGHEQSVLALAFTPDGQTLASAGDDRTVRLWDVASGRELAKFRTGPEPIQGLAFAPDGKMLAASDSLTIHLWDVGTGRERQRREGHEGDISDVAFAPDGRTLATCSMADQTVRLWDAATGKSLHVLRGHEAYVRSVVFLPDGKALLSGGGDSTVRLWDAETGQERRRFTLHETAKGETKQQVLTMRLSTDGRRLVASGTGFDERRQNQVLIGWDVATGARLFRREEAGLDWPMAGPDATTLAVRDRTGISLRDAATGKVLLTLQAASPSLNSPYVFSPDGRLLAVMSFDRTFRNAAVQVYSLLSGKLRRQMPVGLQESARGFSPDGRTLVSADSVGRLRLWEVATGAERGQPGQHEWRVAAVAFSPDGRRLCSGSTDTTALVWDLITLFCDGPTQAELSAGRCQELWTSLAADDARKAYRAHWTLVASPRQSVPFLKDHLRPVPQLDPQYISGLLADLDHTRFATRQKAGQELEKLGPLVEPDLRKALEGQPSLEVRRRLEQLLDKATDAVPGPETLQALRAVEVLEQVGTPEAVQVLQAVARGAPGAPQTQSAQASLDRLSGKAPTP